MGLAQHPIKASRGHGLSQTYAIKINCWKKTEQLEEWRALNNINHSFKNRTGLAGLIGNHVSIQSNKNAQS